MRKVLSFSAFLTIGLLPSQFLPSLAGGGYAVAKTVSSILLYVCLSFIMINVGHESEVDKTRWRSYAEDYFIAVTTAAMSWFLIALYYVFVLLPPEFWNSWEAWKENLLLSRFAAPTSAGIPFTMLAAIGLKSSWTYKKVQVLAVFDDFDTILLMIPLWITTIGMRWQLIVVIFIVFLLLSLGWKRLGKYNWRQDWRAVMGYSILVFVATQAVCCFSKQLYGEEGGIHTEVLLPAFVLDMIMKHKEIDTPVKHKVSTGVLSLFMFLIGFSIPHFVGVNFAEMHVGTHSVTGSQEMMSWGMITLHVLIVSLLSNIGKLFPVFLYRDRKFSERLALSIGMSTRGEVGAGIIFIALGYNLGGPVLATSVPTIVLNLTLTGISVLWVKKLALRSYTT